MTDYYWPGFVDAMAQLLLVITFLLSVFMIAQFLLAREISGQDSALGKLRAQIAELTELLALEKSAKAELEATLSTLTDDFDAEKAKAASSQRCSTGENQKGSSAGTAITGLEHRARPGEADLLRGAGQGRAAQPAARRAAPADRRAQRAPVATPKSRTRPTRRRSSISASGSIRRWPSGCRNCRATARSSSAACARS